MAEFFEIDFLDVETKSSGDAICVRYELGGETYIKRVYALPGEQLALVHYDDDAGDELLDPAAAARLRRLHPARFLPDSRVLAVVAGPRDRLYWTQTPDFGGANSGRAAE